MAGPVTKCFSLIRGRALRVTKLDGCGNTVPGAASSVVSDGFITVSLTANTDTGTEIRVTNAAGRVCILDTPCPLFTGYTVEVAFCGVNPALLNLMTGQPFVVDGAGDIVGFRMNSAVDACDSGFALELWSQVPTAVCEEDADVNYGYFLLPFLKGGVLGDFTVGNDAVNFTLSGAATKDGSQWGVGPYEVVDDDGTPSELLTAIDANDHIHIQLTTLPPPEVDCDTIAVGTKATGATHLGVWTGAATNVYPAWDLADTIASSITASPTTAWGVDEFATTESGENVRWNATTWVHHA